MIYIVPIMAPALSAKYSGMTGSEGIAEGVRVRDVDNQRIIKSKIS